MPVKIHGKDYTTCAERLATFHKRFKDNKKSIISEIIQFKDGIVVIKTVVKVDEEVYVGHAYEEIGSTQINTTSALENCETSSLARSLKFCLGDVDISNEIASAEEVATAINKQEGGYKMKSPSPKKTTSTDEASSKQKGFILKLNREKDYIAETDMELKLQKINKSEASDLIEFLQGWDKTKEKLKEEINSIGAEEVEDQFA